MTKKSMFETFSGFRLIVNSHLRTKSTYLAKMSDVI